MNKRTNVPHKCETCGITFYPFRASTGQFCSNPCKGAALRQVVTKTCVGCGVAFTARPAGQSKYCANECYQQTKRNRTAIERLEANIEKTDYCWLWMGGRTDLGYGRIFFQGKFMFAHRLMYQTVTGKVLPDNVVVRHFECDNPPCCNPAHLREGTKNDNSQDAIRKSRHAHGETTYAKLTEAQAIAVFHDPRKHEEIAKEYGIARRTVGHIKSGATWKHLKLAA